MTSHPDRGQITEPGLRGGTFFAGGSVGGAFFGGGAALAGAVDAFVVFAVFVAGVFFGGGGFLFLRAALAGVSALPPLPLARPLPPGPLSRPPLLFSGALVLFAGRRL